MVTLTKEDWVEIYYALVDKHARINEGNYGHDGYGEIPTDRLINDWSAHLGEIIDKIGPDGERMYLNTN